MSKQRLSICIEGLPWVLGNDLPSWHDGTLVPDLVEFPELNQHIDALGGIARWDDVTIEILDTAVRWAPLLRVVQPTEYKAISPNPITPTTTTITFEDATGIAVGNVLYAENDTWEVTDISGDPDIIVTRKTYTCLEDGWNCYYQSDVTREYTTIASPEGPPTIMGRMVAAYVDGQLEFIGRIVDMAQRGRAWSLQVRSIFDVLAESINAPNVGLRLKHQWNYNAGFWGAGGESYTLTPSTGRGGSVVDMVNDWAMISSPKSLITQYCGFQWQNTGDPGAIHTGHLFHGGASTAGSEWHFDTSYGYHTLPHGFPQYGVIFKIPSTVTGDYLEVSSTAISGGAYNISGLVGQYVRCGDQLLHIASVDTVNGYAYFDRITDAESGMLFKVTSAGYASDAPIELTVAPIIEAADLWTGIVDVLTGTGPLGMGLPAALISDAPAGFVGGGMPIWWDWSESGIEDDLKARGVALVMRGGMINRARMIPPIDAASVYELAQADLLRGEVPEIDRGYEAPVASITYADKQIPWTASWTATSGPGRAALRTLKLTTGAGDTITDPEAWTALQTARLRWLAPGVPTMTLRLLRDVLKIGDVIKLDSRYVSDGHYKSSTLPALVIARDPYTATYQIALNIAPRTGSVWAFGIEVDSVAGAVVTPTLQADLDVWAAVVPVGTEVQITEMDGTVQLWTGTVASYQGTTVTLSSAPTIAADEIAILTCETIPGGTYSTLVERQVYAADASGLIDSTYPAKVLT
jgi:hypothetical protein